MAVQIKVAVMSKKKNRIVFRNVNVLTTVEQKKQITHHSKRHPVGGLVNARKLRKSDLKNNYSDTDKLEIAKHFRTTHDVHHGGHSFTEIIDGNIVRDL